MDGRPLIIDTYPSHVVFFLSFCIFFFVSFLERKSCSEGSPLTRLFFNSVSFISFSFLAHLSTIKSYKLVTFLPFSMGKFLPLSSLGLFNLSCDLSKNEAERGTKDLR